MAQVHAKEHADEASKQRKQRREELMKTSVTTVKGWTERFTLGAASAVVGATRALTDKDLRRLFSRHAKHLFIATFVIIAVIYAIVLPLEWLQSLIFEQGEASKYIRGFREAAGTTIPIMLIAGCRYFNLRIFEDAFFGGLAVRDAPLAEAIRKQKAVFWDWEYFIHLFKFCARQASFGILGGIAYPIFGGILPFIEFGYKLRRMDLVFGIPIAMGFIFDETRWLAKWTVRVWLDSRAVNRELFDPIVSRLKVSKGETDEDKKKDKVWKMWREGSSDSARLGFGLVFGALLELPFIGPFTWFLSFTSAGLFAPDLVQLSSFTKKE